MKTMQTCSKGWPARCLYLALPVLRGAWLNDDALAFGAHPVRRALFAVLTCCVLPQRTGLALSL